MTTRQPDLIERTDAWITSKMDAVVDWVSDHPRVASSVFVLFVAALLLLTLTLSAGTAHALDQVCDPTDPGYDPHVGQEYVSPEGTIHFCTSLDNPAGGRDIDEAQPMSCLLELDAKPYAFAPVVPGQEVLLTVDDEDRSAIHTMRLTCTAFMVAIDGSIHERTSLAYTATFDPVPVPEAPVPLP